jgi:hypothetical protein
MTDAEKEVWDELRLLVEHHRIAHECGHSFCLERLLLYDDAIARVQVILEQEKQVEQV